MQFLEAIGYLKKEQLIDSIAMMKTTTFFNSQLNVLATTIDKGSNAVIQAISGAMKNLGEWGTSVKEQEGFLGGLGKLFSDINIKEGGEKLEKQVVNLSEGFVKRFKQEKDILANIDEKSLQTMFEAELVRLTNFSGEAADLDGFTKHILSELSDLYKIDTRLTNAIDVEGELFTHFMNSLMDTAKKRLQGSKDEVLVEKNLQAELDSMTDEDKQKVREALKIEALTYTALKDYFINAAPLDDELIRINAHGYGIFLALISLLRAISQSFGIVSPLADFSLLTNLLIFLLSPIGGILIAGGLFTYLEWLGSKTFDRQVLAYVIIPLWLDLYSQKYLTVKQS